MGPLTGWCLQVAQHASATSPLLEELPIDGRVAVIALEHAWRARTLEAGEPPAAFMPPGVHDFKAAADDLGTSRGDGASALLLRMCHGAPRPVKVDILWG